MKKRYCNSVLRMHSLLTVKITAIAFILVCKVFVVTAQTVAFPIKPIDTQRVQQIEQLLPDVPSGYGDPYYKREVWDTLLNSGRFNGFLLGMTNYVFPPFSDADYFSLSDGSASSSQRGLTMMRKRAEGLSKATWAECLENQGNYTQMVKDGLLDIINQKSWVSPRVDYDFKNYNGIEYSVDLTSSLYAHTIAQTLYLMGDKIDSTLRQQAINALYLRVFNPVLNKISTQNTNRENDFLITASNWNHVCLAGLVGAALTAIESKHERAVFVSIGEYYSKNGLTAFNSDGYCTEGMRYYNYGFGHYVLLRESIWQATAGQLDLFNGPKVRKIASYAPNLEIVNNVYPTISDASEGDKPDADLMTYLSRNLGLGLTKYDTLTFKANTVDIRNEIMMAFPNSSSEFNPGVGTDKVMIRSFFDQTGVLVCRPRPCSIFNIGVALKGGNNAESHNHNDIGSYTIVQGNQIMVGDPGAIPYTANIFNPQYRYTYKTIGSYGHPVPLVAGTEQQPGDQAASQTIFTDFSLEKDSIKLDIASAYNVPGLNKLERTMNYSREGTGSVTFTDYFEYTQPKSFETAISTRAEWTQTSSNTLELSRGSEKTLVTFSSPGNSLALRSEVINEGDNVRHQYTRIGIYITQPASTGKIIISYKKL